MESARNHILSMAENMENITGSMEDTNANASFQADSVESISQQSHQVSEAVEALRAIVSDPFASGSDRVRAATEILRAYFLTERTDNDNR
jgi:methyl-accepting chemotaxis protein